MLVLYLPEIEGYDDAREEFFALPAKTIKLEHSLYSISEWEQKYEKPFLSNDKKTQQEMLYYFCCMQLNNPDKDYSWVNRLTQKDCDSINSYISANRTATTIRELPGKRRQNRILTNEVLYCWMVLYGIPFECQYWHLNRLITLIKVCNAEVGPKQKMAKSAIVSQNQSLNRQRLKQYNTRG